MGVHLLHQFAQLRDIHVKRDIFPFGPQPSHVVILSTCTKYQRRQADFEHCLRNLNLTSEKTWEVFTQKVDEQKKIMSKHPAPSQVENLIFTRRDIDKTAASLLPTDSGDVLPVKVIGDGSCLYHSVSTSLVGDTSLSKELRCRVVFDFIEHFDSYERLMRRWNNSDFFDQRTVRDTTDTSKYSSLVHMVALATCLNIRIESVYPEVNERLRADYNKTINPLSSDRCVSGGITTMWTRTDLWGDSHFWQPNHFVPLFDRSKFDMKQRPFIPERRRWEKLLKEKKRDIPSAQDILDLTSTDLVSCRDCGLVTDQTGIRNHQCKKCLYCEERLTDEYLDLHISSKHPTKKQTSNQIVYKKRRNYCTPTGRNVHFKYCDFAGCPGKIREVNGKSTIVIKHTCVMHITSLTNEVRTFVNEEFEGCPLLRFDEDADPNHNNVFYGSEWPEINFRELGWGHVQLKRCNRKLTWDIRKCRSKLCESKLNLIYLRGPNMKIITCSNPHNTGCKTHLSLGIKLTRPIPECVQTDIVPVRTCNDSVPNANSSMKIKIENTISMGVINDSPVRTVKSDQLSLETDQQHEPTSEVHNMDGDPVMNHPCRTALNVSRLETHPNSVDESKESIDYVQQCVLLGAPSVDSVEKSETPSVIKPDNKIVVSTVELDTMVDFKPPFSLATDQQSGAVISSRCHNSIKKLIKSKDIDRISQVDPNPIASISEPMLILETDQENGAVSLPNVINAKPVLRTAHHTLLNNSAPSTYPCPTRDHAEIENTKSNCCLVDVRRETHKTTQNASETTAPVHPYKSKIMKIDNYGSESSSRPPDLSDTDVPKLSPSSSDTEKEKDKIVLNNVNSKDRNWGKKEGMKRRQDGEHFTRKCKGCFKCSKCDLKFRNRMTCFSCERPGMELEHILCKCALRTHKQHDHEINTEIGVHSCDFKLSEDVNIPKHNIYDLRKHEDLDAVLNDGFTWGKYIPWRVTGGIKKYRRRCRGGQECPNEDCPFLHKSNRNNTYHFCVKNNDLVCNVCSCIAVHRVCLAYKDMWWDDKESSIVHVNNHGGHKCKVDSHDTPGSSSLLEPLRQLFKVFPNIKLNEAIKTCMREALMKDDSALEEKATLLINAKKMRQVKNYIQNSSVASVGGAKCNRVFGAIYVFRDKVIDRDRYLVYDIVDGEFVFTTSHEKLLLAIELSGQTLNTSDGYVHLDFQASRVKGMSCFSGSVYYTFMRETVTLFKCYTKRESSEAVVYALNTWRKAVDEVGEGINILNPKGWMADEAGAIHKGLVDVFGVKSKEKTVSCIAHYRASIRRNCRKELGSPKLQETFKRLALSLQTCIDVTDYDERYHMLINFIRERRSRSYLFSWLGWWHSRRCHWAEAFRPLYAPSTNLAEVTHAREWHRGSYNVCLSDAIIDDAVDSVMFKAKSVQYLSGKYPGGTGPASTDLQTKLDIRKIKRARRMGQKISDSLQCARDELPIDETATHRDDKHVSLQTNAAKNSTDAMISSSESDDDLPDLRMQFEQPEVAPLTFSKHDSDAVTPVKRLRISHPPSDSDELPDLELPLKDTVKSPLVTAIGKSLLRNETVSVLIPPKKESAQCTDSDDTPDNEPQSKCVQIVHRKTHYRPRSSKKFIATARKAENEFKNYHFMEEPIELAPDDEGRDFLIFHKICNDRTYKVKLAQKPSCTCPYFQEKKGYEICKHIVMIMMCLGLNESNKVMNQTSYSPKETELLMTATFSPRKHNVNRTVETKNTMTKETNGIAYLDNYTYVAGRPPLCCGCLKCLTHGLVIVVNGRYRIKNLSKRHSFRYCVNLECYSRVPKNSDIKHLPAAVYGKFVTAEDVLVARSAGINIR